MNTLKFDVKQIKPEALNLFYSHIIKTCHSAKKDKATYDEYLAWKKRKQSKEE
ncbi:MAG: hypothetical protein ACLRT4_13420 [Thomasclavelia sp.]